MVHKSIYYTQTDGRQAAAAVDGRVIVGADVDIIHGQVQESAANNAFVLATPYVLDVPRIVTATFAAGWQGGDIFLTGTDYLGRAVTDTIADAAGTTVAGTTIFKTVTAITKQTVAGTTDTVTIGIGAVNYYSIPFCPCNSDGFSLHMVTTGTLTGTETLWYSNRPAPSLSNDDDWFEDADFDPTDPAGSATEWGVTAGNCKFRWARVKYAHTSGSGILYGFVALPSL